MKEKVYNKSGTKQLIDSGWRLFDKQTNCITTGNAYCNTQFSSFIRPFSKTECNGIQNPQGHLLYFDLGPFRKFQIPTLIKDILTDESRKESVILYMFFVSKEHIEPFCWAVTTKDYKLIQSVTVYGYKQNYNKRAKASLEAISYITE